MKISWEKIHDTLIKGHSTKGHLHIESRDWQNKLMMRIQANPGFEYADGIPFQIDNFAWSIGAMTMMLVLSIQIFTGLISSASDKDLYTHLLETSASSSTVNLIWNDQ